MCRKLSGLDGRKIIQTGNEPSVAPHVPSVTAHLLQGCCSRFNHLQTQAAPIHHPSPSSLHTNNVVLGPINRVMASPPKTGLMSFAALSKAKRCARSPKTTTSPMKRCGGCFMRRASKERIQERNRKLEAFIRWEDALFSNPHLSGNHKLEIRATRRAVQRAQTHDAQGRAHINLTTIAEQIGVSPDTMGRGLKVLKQCGVIADQDLKPELQENGERWTRHYVTLNEDLLKRPKEIQLPAPRNHGGNRYHCQQCGSDQVRIKRRVTLVCKCCQQVDNSVLSPNRLTIPINPAYPSF